MRGACSLYQDSAQSFQRVEDSARLEFRPLRCKHAQPPRTLIKLLGKRWQVDRSDPTLPRQTVDFSAPAQNRNIQPQHLRLGRIVEEELAGRQAKRVCAQGFFVR